MIMLCQRSQMRRVRHGYPIVSTSGPHLGEALVVRRCGSQTSRYRVKLRYRLSACVSCDLVSSKHHMEGPLPVKKSSDLACELAVLVDQCLFGDQPWPPDRERIPVLIQKLSQLEDVSAGSSEFVMFHNTDLLSAFMGISEDCDIVTTLEGRGLLSKEERESVFEQWDRGTVDWIWLERRVRRAYLQHANGAERLI
jgi:hypothetical protein